MTTMVPVAGNLIIDGVAVPFSGSAAIPDPVNGKDGTSPTALSIANVLAATPSFISAVAAALPAAPPVVVPPPVVIPPATDTLWVYRNGVTNPQFDLDVSFVGSANYKDTTGLPQGGTADILFTGTQYNAGWQLMISACQTNKAACLDTTKYKFLVIDLKPTVANQKWQIGFMSSGDTTDGPVIDISPYGPAAVVGKWGTYKIPLSAFGLTNTTVLKYWVQGNTQGALRWYIDNTGFATT